jgi:Flp pilus assembly protein TadG
MKLPTGEKAGLGQAPRRQRGQSLVEFAVVAPLFFLLVFGITDFGLMFFRLETLQFAVREAGRYAVTGQGGTGATRVAAIEAVAAKYAEGVPYTINVISGGVTNTTAGGPRDMVTVQLISKYYFITPLIGKFFPGHDGTGNGGYYAFTVSTTFMNEPFSGGG